MPDKPKTHSSPGMEAERAARRKQRDNMPQQRLLHTARWKRFRKSLLSERPLCEDCQRVAAIDIHHVRGLGAHPEDLLDGEQVKALCHRCHSRRTARGE